MAQKNPSVNDAGSAEAGFTELEQFATAELSGQLGSRQSYFTQGKIYANDGTDHITWQAKHSTADADASYAGLLA